MAKKPSTKTVRAVKFEVVFPGLRKKDRSPFFHKLWTLQDELTRAANRLISALYQVRLGAIPWPEVPDKDGVLKPIPFQSLAYKAIGSLRWMPFDRPVYQPTEGVEAGSNVLLDLAGVVHTRTGWRSTRAAGQRDPRGGRVTDASRRSRSWREERLSREAGQASRSIC